MIQTDLENKIKDYKERFLAHQRRSYEYKVAYYSLGAFLSLLSVLLAALTSLDFDSALDKLKFVLSVLVGTLSTVLNFIALEKRIQEHHDAKINYMTLYKDLKTHLLKSDKEDLELMESLEALYVEKEKLIIATEPSLYVSWCSNTHL